MPVARNFNDEARSLTPLGAVVPAIRAMMSPWHAAEAEALDSTDGQRAKNRFRGNTVVLLERRPHFQDRSRHTEHAFATSLSERTA